MSITQILDLEAQVHKTVAHARVALRATQDARSLVVGAALCNAIVNLEVALQALQGMRKDDVAQRKLPLS